MKCAVSDCDFETGLKYNCFDEHCKSVHQWADVPYLIDDCQYVAYSNAVLAKHRTVLHSIRNRTYLPKEHKCTWKNCHTSFQFASLLTLHMNIHTNNLYRCSFCPYKAAKPVKLMLHYRSHYKVYDYKCEDCDKVYTSKDNLRRHISQLHDFEMASCPLCDRVGKRGTISTHLNSKHKVYSKWNKAINSFDIFER